MAKKITVNDKLKQKIASIVSDKLCLTDVGEFAEFAHCELFDEPPAGWSELENTICDYISRKQDEVSESVFDLLKNGNAR